ncbi:MAG TPA: L-dopachrome tautomerase-related protein [Candidatus Saccharimonadales bacterium]|jgi:sugar lactone lactonase YvrE|nr:L-dopachrome tautomerase-related protein [Candidatus Saccharimonadales bacterium]
MRKLLVRGLLLFLILLSSLVVWFEYRYGGSVVLFPDKTTAPLLPASRLEVVATLDEAPGNIAVSRQGRVFFNFHPEGRPELKVAEIVDGHPLAFPNHQFQQNLGGGKPYFDCVFSVRIDRQDRLWTLDHGFHGFRQPRLLAFDLQSGNLVHQFDFPSNIAGPGSYIQDMQIDPEGKKVYIADLSALAQKPAIIVYDVEKKRARRLLERDGSVMDKPYLIDAKGKLMVLLGRMYKMHPALDSIGLDRQGEWLYYGAMSSETMHRIRTADLNDESLSPSALQDRVQRFGPKVQSDGITVDNDGNVYITDVEHGAISMLGPDRQLVTLLRDERIRWPDGLSYGPGGYIYITDSDFPDIMLKSKSHIKKNAPYYIFRFKSDHSGVPGS